MPPSCRHLMGGQLPWTAGKARCAPTSLLVVHIDETATIVASETARKVLRSAGAREASRWEKFNRLESS